MAKKFLFDHDRFKGELRDFCINKYGIRFENANLREKYMSLAETIMTLIGEDWLETTERNKKKRKAYYLSAEFYIGRSTGNNLLNLRCYEDVDELFEEMGIKLSDLEEQEEDAALGNGGLGRLAACFIDSAATMGLPVQGYGVRYSQGIFKQKFKDGFQEEEGDDWTHFGEPWSIRREDEAQIVEFRDQKVRAIPYDMPVIGYDNDTINTLRLWQAEAIRGFDFQRFNNYEYDRAVEEKNRAEDITRVLYPNDNQRAGKVLRLKQQYFFVSASVQDMVIKYKQNFPQDKSFKDFPDYHIMQLNDTHPVIAIPEVMRILMDQEGLSWEEAMNITNQVFAFTNHTVLQEALERWDVDIFEEVSPRCFEIVREMDRRLEGALMVKGTSDEQIARMKIINNNTVNMANIALGTSVSVNGVAEIHSQILREDTLKDWYQTYPEKFNSKTNGVTPRRWLFYSNPELTSFMDELLGSEDWKGDMGKLKGLEKYVEDDEVLKELNSIKYRNKVRLANYIYEHEGIKVDPNSIFDIQVKRIHEYKRQLLNAFHIVYLYNKIKKDPNIDMIPRTFIFGGKAAPGYFAAKGIIKFINEIAKLVNNDPDVNDKIKVVFVENYRVSYAEKIFPAADVSEQISTAGKEASGTGNMKFMMNGALTLGTMDGANVEIFEEAGVENNFLFGAKVEELREIEPTYNPNDYYMTNKELKEAIDILMGDKISDNGSYMFLTLYNSLVNPQNGQRGDQYYILKDFDSYCKAHEKIDQAYRDRRSWAQKCLINIANSGKFSSDRTIEDYNDGIWHLEAD